MIIISLMFLVTAIVYTMVIIDTQKLDAIDKYNERKMIVPLSIGAGAFYFLSFYFYAVL